ncbi:ComEC/Rec2 family competence protein [Streptomyces sp. NPDC056749]|uniref:ComEC/Rec2 family competence protein n=1 Tax=Streptomyces sp. NPDC056749 TaxID=3345936 RepID=UPI0036B3F589
MGKSNSQLSKDASVEILFLDVGQGDATLAIDWSTSRGLLIDCPPGRESVVEDAVESRGIDLDTVIVSHWDMDHFGGIMPIIDSLGGRALRFNFDTMYEKDSKTKSFAVHRRLLDAKYESIEMGPAEEDHQGEIGNLTYKIVAPQRQHLLQALVTRDRNLASAVVLLEAHGSRVIVAGDADGRVWHRLIDRNVPLTAEVLRWPHHGASIQDHRSVNNLRVLQATGAEHVVASLGTRNRYGHPTTGMVSDVNGLGARVICTEATSACHPFADGSAHPCAGTVAVHLYSDGTFSLNPTLSDHSSKISQWEHPICNAKP